MTRINKNIASATSPWMSGDSRIIQCTVQGPTGDAYPLTGAAIKWQAFLASGGGFTGSAIITKTVGSGIVITNAVGGVFQITVNPADTESLAGTYYHEAEVTIGSVVHTVFTGLFTIVSDAVV